MIYGIVGGTPQYLLQINDSLSVEDNIKENVLDPNSYLFEEPANLLKQEVQKASLYNAIISAIATGSTKISEISVKVPVKLHCNRQTVERMATFCQCQNRCF